MASLRGGSPIAATSWCFSALGLQGCNIAVTDHHWGNGALEGSQLAGARCVCSLAVPHQAGQVRALGLSARLHVFSLASAMSWLLQALIALKRDFQDVLAPDPGTPEHREALKQSIKERNDELAKPPGFRDEARLLWLTKRVLRLRIEVTQVVVTYIGLPQLLRTAVLAVAGGAPRPATDAPASCPAWGTCGALLPSHQTQ